MLPPVQSSKPVPRTAALPDRFRAVRAQTEAFCAPLETEDYVVQSMEDVSPTKWHLAHTTWFWEQFVLKPYLDGYEEHHEQYAYLFNSYYVQAGERHCRAQRGYLSRPTVEEVYAYRRHVDEAMDRLFETQGEALKPTLAETIEIGLNHEQQHQELMVTDLKHVLSVNPLRPAYRAETPAPSGDPGPIAWVPFEAGLHEMGADSTDLQVGEGFRFDNEEPRHRAFVEAFELADRLVTNGEYLKFMADGGYERPELWLSAGWAIVQERGWTAPFYWQREGDGWGTYTLHGWQAVDPHAPVTHVSYFEADAYARWAGVRLASEAEWEAAARTIHGDAVPQGHFADDGYYHPRPAPAPASGDGLAGQPVRQLFGTAWEWTGSQYTAYPGYRPAPGALGEYNGKFMCNQFVLRGGSCATPGSHVRATYRNFFPPDAAWQFTGIRLARTPR